MAPGMGALRFGIRLMNKNPATEKLTGGSLLARNSIFNLLGQLAPLLVALLTIPLLIQGLGTERFGVLALAWMVIGYFGLFDLGLGRALTLLVAEKLGAGQEEQLPGLVWITLALMLILGLLLALVVSSISPWLAHSALKIPGMLQAETLNVFYLLAGAIPIVVVSGGLSGILAALQRFDILNAIRIPMGIYGFVAPLLILQFSNNLFIITAAMVVGRVVEVAANFFMCMRVMPILRTRFVLQYTAIKSLFRFGAWMTIGNIVGTIIVYMDRFFIGAVVSMAAVAYYTTPYDMAIKLWIIPGAVLAVLFPAFAASYRQDHGQMVRLFVSGTKYVVLALFPIVLMIVAFAGEALRWWLGDEFARHSTPVLRWLMIGVFINSVAQVFVTLVQGVGRPDLSAKLHLLELPFYFFALWWAVENYEILGVAMVWVGRVALDGILLLYMSTRFLGESAALFRRIGTGIIFAVIILVIPILINDFYHRVVVTALIMISFVFVAWARVLTASERAYVKDRAGVMGG